MGRTSTWFAVVAGLTLVTGCTDFPSPAELTRPTILAVVADPPIVAPGAAAELSVVMAGPDGPLDPDVVTFRLTELLPGVPPFGALVDHGDGTATYTAPDPVPDPPGEAPPADAVELTIDADGTSVVALKVIGVVDLPSANPVITSLLVGEAEASAASPLSLVAGVRYPLEVDIEPGAGADATYAWYSTIGEIEHYQSNPAELLVADDVDDGWLFVVVRDGLTGVVVRGVAVTVE